MLIMPTPVERAHAIPASGRRLDLRSEDPLSGEHGRGRAHSIELGGRDRQWVAIEHDKVGQLARGYRALPVFTTGDVGAADGVGAECLLRGEGFSLLAQVTAGRRRAIDRGVYSYPGVVIGDIAVGRPGKRYTGIEVGPHRHGATGTLRSDAVDEPLAQIRQER